MKRKYFLKQSLFVCVCVNRVLYQYIFASIQQKMVLYLVVVRGSFSCIQDGENLKENYIMQKSSKSLFLT
ncbi:unnamed protein product [Cuscuta campestris]|uniref:Uncharacterized protein n=1 Tax=Cuscuta campestris TaxID=132261 RepID=A0A484NBD5_9ASTE|nr:unnamed protein product [Cuscuta campestris]